MTRNAELKSKVNEVTDMLQYFLNNNDHKNAQRCADLIAEMIASIYLTEE